MAETLDYDALLAARAKAVTEANDEHTRAEAEIERQIAALQDTRNARLAELEVAHEAELKARSATLARLAHTRIGPLYTAYRKSGDRKDALAVASALRTIEIETRKALGTQFNGHGTAREVLGSRLWVIAVASYTSRDEGALPAFANAPNLGANGAIETIGRAMRALLDPHVTGSEAADVLDQLEAAVSHAARYGNRATSPQADERDRLIAYCHWHRPSDLAAALAELDAKRADAVKRETEQRTQDIRAARFSDGTSDQELDARNGAGWARGIRSVLGRLRIAEGGAVRDA